MILSWMKNVLRVMSAAADRNKGRTPSRLMLWRFLEALESGIAPLITFGRNATSGLLRAENSATSGNAGKGQRQRRFGGPSWARLILEELEPRLAPTANINYLAPPSGSNLTLRVAQVSGVANLQLVNNANAAVIQGVVLNQDCVVQITGSALASDTLTVNFSYTGGGTPEPITVLFDGKPNLITTDKVIIAGAGTQYQPQSFTLQSDDNIVVSGTLKTIGDISLTDSQQSTGAIGLPGIILANASTNITVNGGSLSGHNITLAAQSTINANSQSASLFNGLVRVGTVVASSSAAVQVLSGSLNATGDLNVTAVSNVSSVLTTAPASAGTSNSDAAVSTSTVASNPSVLISGGTLSAGGKANLAASNLVSVTTTADGTAGGSAGSAQGGTVGVTVLTGDTSATVSAGTLNAAEVDLSATSNRSVTTVARATQGGAVPGSPTNTQGQQTLTNYNAKTSDGQVNVAAAVAVTSLTGDTTARVIGGSTTSTINPLTINATATNAPTTTADASAASGAPGTGVGAAVAIGRTSANSIASLGGTANVTAGAVNVNSLMPASTFTVGATSGAGWAAVGVAGSLAIDVSSVHANAQVEAGSTVNVHGASLSLSAQSTTASRAAALPKKSAGQSVGIGASVAFNVSGAGERAAVENNAKLVGANGLTVSALGNDTTTTTTLAGAAGGTAVAGAVSLAIPSGATEAVIGSGPALALAGGLTLTASRTSVINTHVDSAVAASGTAVGASVGWTNANESATATVGRSVTSGAAAALVHADGHDSSNSTALASVSGAKPGSTVANTLLGNLATFVSGNGWTPGVVTLPTAATPDGKFGVAGAIAVNNAALDASAQVLPGASLQIASGGALTVEAMTTYADTALADATAVNTATGIAAVVAINLSTPTAEAIISGSVSADALTITATVSGQTDVTANSGQGSTNVGVAGAFALDLPGAVSHADIAAGGSVVLTGPPTGDVTVQATTTVSHDNARADAKALGFANTGVGASAAFDIPGNGATAEVSGMLTSPDQVTITATGNYTATALATAGATGGTAVAPALALAVPHNTTLALVGAAAIVSAGGAMLVQATHRGNVTSRSRADSAGANVAVGAALAIGVAADSDEAEVAGRVTHSGSFSIGADLGSASQSLASAGSNGATTGGTPINSLINNVVGFGKNNKWVPSSVQAPTAKTADGNLQVAAAAAINIDLTKGTATIATGGAVTTSSPLLVQTTSAVNASAFADGTSADGSATGIGAALAINVAHPVIEASVAGAVTAPAVTIQTMMGGSGTNTDTATAWSGAGATGTGVAGALAINVLTNSSEAAVRNSAVLTLSGGDLTVAAAAAGASASEALAQTSPSDTVLGLGGSVAVSVDINSTHADIGAAAISGANNITVTATANYHATAADPALVKAVAGVHLDNAAAAAAVAVVYSGSQTTAELLSATTTITLTGSVNVQANDTAPVTANADATSVATGAGAGVAIGVGVNRESVTARDARNVNAGGFVHVQANTDSPTTTSAAASADGGKSIAQALDSFIGQQIGLGDPNAGNASKQVNVPGVGPTLTTIQNTVGLALPVLGVAATISVTVSQPQTLAEIAAGTIVAAGAAGDVAVRTSVAADAISTADAHVQNNLADGGLALAVNFAGGSNRAAVADNVTITAPSITVAAGLTHPLMFTVSADSGAGAVAAGAAGAIALNAGANTMQAQIGKGDHLTATGNVSITATSTLDATTIAGGQALALGAGVGASLAASGIQDETDSLIGNSQVDAGQKIEVNATAHQNLSAVAVNGSGAFLGTVAGSITVNALVATTRAFTDFGAQLNQTLPASVAQSILIRAEDDTTVMGGAGVFSGALLGSLSAAVDASAIQKNTQAFLGGRVDSGGDITVAAFSDEGSTSISGTLGLSVLTTLAGSGGISHLNITTKAFVDSGANVLAKGNVQITADDHSETDVTADSTSYGIVAAAGAALAVGWNTKDTEAYIAGADATRADPFQAGGTLGAATVQALGNTPAINAGTGDFTITYVAPTTGNGKVTPPLSDVATALAAVLNNPILDAIANLVSSLFGLVSVVDAPPIDPALSQQRVATPQTTSFQGIAVTATTRDDIADHASGASGSLAGTSIAPELSGAAALMTNQTNAFIAKGAQATSSQSIRVAAGSDAYNLGIAGTQAIGGLATVGASGSLSFINNTTQSYVAGSAMANFNVEILAHGKEDIVAMATGLSAQTGSFGASLSASLPLIAINNHTHAFVDAGGIVHALGNVLVLARDDSQTNSLAGQATFKGGTGVGVGASAAVTLITKDTQAYIGQNATVHADGTTADTVSAYTGTANFADSFPLGFATETVHGLAVQAASSEQVFNVAAGGAASLGGIQLQITGSLDFYVTRSNTAAYIDSGATVTAQQVNVSAVNDLHAWDAAVNLNVEVGPSVGVAGGFDIGLDRNNTTATIGGNVTARGDVEVHALSRTLIDSFVGAAGATVGGIGLDASVSLISIRGNFAPILGIIPLDFLNISSSVDTVQSKLDSVIANLSSNAGGGIAKLLNNFDQGVGSGNAAANALSAAAPTNPATTAVTQSLAGLGTQAHISGGTVQAGGKVAVTGQEVIDAHLNTSFTFNFDVGALIALKNDRGILSTGGVAGGFIDSGAQVTAASGPVIVSGNVVNTQQIAASTAVNGTKNLVSAVIRGVATTITPAITATGSQQVAVGDTTGISSGMALVVNAGQADQETVTVTAVDATTITANFAKMHAAGVALTLAQQTTVNAPASDVDLTATSDTHVKYMALLPAYDELLQAKSSSSSMASTVDAHISAGAHVTAQNNVNVRAKDTGEIFVLAVALTFGAKGFLRVGANLTTNDIADTVTAYLAGATVTATTGTIALNATSVQNIESIGIGSALEAGGTIAGAGSYVSTDVGNTIEAYIQGGLVTALGDITLAAADSDGGTRTTILGISGGVAGSLGTSAVGAAITNNTLENTIKTFIDGANVTSQSGNVDLNANSNLSLNTAALALSAAETFALGGSVTLNKDRNVIDAAIENGATVMAQGSVNVNATDTPALLIAAGGLSGSTSVAVGAGVAINNIGDMVKARIDKAFVTAITGNVQVLSNYKADMTKLVVVGGGGAGTVGIAGSVDINDIANTVQASISNQANVTANDSVAVVAQTETDLSPIVGTLSFGGSVGIGGSVILDEFSDNTSAFITDNSQVIGHGNAPVTVPLADGSSNTAGASGVAVIATTYNPIAEVNINAGLSPGVSVAATVGIDLISDTTQAYIDGSTVNPNNSADNAAQAVLVRAANHTDVDVKAGVLTLSGSVSVGATSDTNLISNTTQAYIKDNAHVNARSNVEVTAFTQDAVNAVVISAAGSLAAGVAGQAPVLNLSSDTEAYIDGSSVNANGDLKVLANSDSRLGSRKGGSNTGIIAGALGIGLGGGVGGSVIVATIAPTTKAHLTNATTNASGTTQVEADSLDSEKTYDITAAGGVYLGLAGSVIVTTIKPDTEAFIDGTSQVNQDGNFITGSQAVTVEATDDTEAQDLAGAAAGGIAGIGASIDVLTVRNATVAYIDAGATVSAGGDVQVLAEQKRNVSSIVLAFSGGIVALQAGVSVVNVGSAMSADGNTRAGGTESVVDSQIHSMGGATAGMLPNDSAGVATGAANKADAQTGALNVDDAFNAAQPAAVGTSASIRGSVSAGGNIKVEGADGSEVQSISGSGGGGLVSAGAAVAISNIAPSTSAYIAGAGSVAAAGTINVHATFTLNQSGQHVADAFAGGGGFVAAAGAVISVSDNSTQAAYIGGNAHITKAQSVSINAEGTRTLTVLTGQITGGAVALGAAIAVVSAAGSTEAYVTDGAQIGKANNLSVGSLSVTANGSTSIDVQTVAISVGLVGASGNDAEAKIESPTIAAYIAGSAQVQTTGDVDVEAISTANAQAKTAGVDAGGIGVGVSLSTATITPSVTAYVGGSANVNAGGNLTLRARHNANANGTPIADGATATSFASAGGALLGGTGGSADATASASLDTYVDTGATIRAGSAITIASLANDNAQSTLTGVAAGAVGIGVGLSSATTSGSAKARMEGTVQGGQSLTVSANSLDNAGTTSFGFAGGIVGVDAAAADAEASPTVNALIDGGVTVSGQAEAQAIGNKTTKADVKGLAIGGLAIAGMIATGKTAGPTTAQVNGSVHAGSVQVLAAGTENAGAHVLAGSVGAISGVGGKAHADDSGTVQASIGGSANLMVTGAVVVNGTSNGTSTADAGGGAAGLGAVAAMFAEATRGGSTTAFVAGSVMSDSLAVTAGNTQGANAKSDVAEISVIGGAGSKTEATVGGTVEAFLGTQAGSAPSGSATTLHIINALTVQANSQTNATANLSVGSGGLINGELAQCNATSNGTTRAYLGDGTALGNGVVASAGTITVTATASDVASSNASIAGGGLGNLQDDSTNVTVAPTIAAYFGKNVSATTAHDVDIEATSNDAEGHASANFAGGGGLQVGVADANETSKPNVQGYIDSGSVVMAGGNVTVNGSALSKNTLNDQITNVDTSNGSITDPSLSGVHTGDPVVYDYGSSSAPIRSNGRALQDDRSFHAIVVGPNTVQLGSTFNAQSVNASDPLVTGQSGVDPTLNVIQFAGANTFQTGDEVQYDDMGNPDLSGLSQGNAYFVRSVTGDTIKLYSSESAAQAPGYYFVPSDKISVNVKSSSPHDITSTPIQNPMGVFFNDEAVTYEAPTPIPFTFQAVANNAISLGGLVSNLNNGDRIIFKNDSGSGEPITGLVNGTTYFVVNKTTTSIQLATTSGGSPITLTPTGNSAGCLLQQPNIGLVNASGNGIGQLQNGHTYYVVKATNSAFQLSASVGGSPLFLNANTTAGTHQLFPDGIALGAASGTQNLHLAFSNAGQRGDVMLPGTVFAPSGGSGESTSNAGGGSGGIIDVSKPSATTSFNPTVMAYIAAQTVNGNNISINSEVVANTNSHADNAGGGLGYFGDASETTNFTSTSQASVSGGVTINALARFTLSSDTQLNTGVSGHSDGGGLVASVKDDANANADAKTNSSVGAGAQIHASSVDLSATGSKFNVAASPSATAGGLGGSATANANSSITSTAQVMVAGGTTAIDGPQGVALRALNENLSPNLNADGTFYGIFSDGGDSNNNNNYNLKSYIQTDANANITAGPWVTGLSTTPSWLTSTLHGQFPTLALYVQAQDIGINHDNDGSKAEDQNVVWNANVTILSGAPTLIIDSSGLITTDIGVPVTDGEGGPSVTTGQTITSGTAVVTDLLDHQIGQAFFIGAGGHNGDGVENGDNSAPPTAASYPLFTFDYAFQSVTIINLSANALDIHKIDVVDRTDATTTGSAAEVQIDSPNYPTNKVPFGFNIANAVQPTLIDIENQQNAAKNQTPSDINLFDVVQNPVGQTVIKNARGNINAPNSSANVWSNILDIEATGSIGVAPFSANPIFLNLIESEDPATSTIRPIQLTAVATNGSVNLDVTARRRDGNAGVFTVNVQKISAGQNINMVLEKSMQDPGTGTASSLIVAAQNFANPSQVDAHPYLSFFYPDPGNPPPSLNAGAFVNLNAATTIAVTLYQFGFDKNGAAVANPGLTAGGNIIVEAAAPNPADPIINIIGTTDLTGATGYIDTTTNGSITYTEAGGTAMRIGTISSTSANVLLTNTDLASAAGQDLDVVQNDRTNGLISAKTTIVLNVGDNLNTFGNNSSTGSMLTAGTSITINLDNYPGADPDPATGSTANINGAISSPLTDIFGNSNSDAINLNYAAGINNFTTSVVPSLGLLNMAQVVVDGKGPATNAGNSLKVDDSGDPGADSGFMTSDTVFGVGMGGIGVHYTNIQALEVDLSQGGTTTNGQGGINLNGPGQQLQLTNFTVYSTNKTTPTLIKGGAGNDIVYVGSTPAAPAPTSLFGTLPGPDAGDLNTIQGVLTVNGNGGQDYLEVNDHANSDGPPATTLNDPAYGYDYIVTPTSVVNDARLVNSVPVQHQSIRPNFAGIVYNNTNTVADSVAFLSLNGTDRTNRFAVTPSTITTYLINAELPNTSCRKDGGDYLMLDTTHMGAPGSAGVFSRKLHIFTNPATTPFADPPYGDPTATADAADGELASPTGNGYWNFVKNGKTYAKPVYFLSMEQFNHVAVVATVTPPSPNSSLAPQVVVKDAETGEVEYTVQPFENSFHGGLNPVVGDLNCDGIPDLAVAPQDGHTPIINLYNGTPDANGNYLHKLMNSFNGFNPQTNSSSFLGGLSLGIGDVNYDGHNDLVVGFGPGYVPTIQVFNGETILNAKPSLLGKPFTAFSSAFGETIDQNFHGGVSLAVGDLNNDGYADIVASVASNGPAIVNVFNGNGYGFMRGFYAFKSSNVPGGLSLAVGDINGDGMRDIVVGSALGYSPAAAIFSGATLFTAVSVQPLKTVSVAPPTFRGAIIVQAEPTDGGNPGTVEHVSIFAELLPVMVNGGLATPLYVTLTPFQGGAGGK